MSTNNTYLRVLNILFFALFAGQILFFAIAFYLVRIGGFEYRPDLDPVFRYIVPAAALLFPAAGFFFFSKQLKSLPPELPLDQKLFRYRGAWIFKMASIEGPAMLAIIVFLLTRNYAYAVIAGAIIIAFLLNKPQAHKIIRELNLSYEEQIDFGQAAQTPGGEQSFLAKNGWVLLVLLGILGYYGYDTIVDSAQKEEFTPERIEQRDTLK